MKVFGLILLLSIIAITMRSFSVRSAKEQAKVKIEMINYNGWDKSYKLSNKDIEVVVVPAVGRIMYVGFKDGKNILWNNQELYGKSLPQGNPITKNGEIIWANFGGDKVWPVQESNRININGYRWPPDHWFDGSAHKAVIIEKGIKIISPVSEYSGARCIREIILDNTGVEMTINQTIEKVKQAHRQFVEPINYTIWNITQIRPPCMALFNLNPNSRHPDRYIMIKPNTINNFSVNGNIGVLIPDNQKEQKAGADSDHWLAAIFDNAVFAEFFRLQPDMKYPDNGLSAEVYTEPGYTELELLSPLKQLNIGEEMQYSIQWRIHKLSRNIISDRERRSVAIEWLNTYVN